MTDPIADMLTRVRNASRALKPETQMPYSKMKESIAAILKKQGYIRDYQVEDATPKRIKLLMKYDGRKPVIAGLRRVSSPGLRRYTGAREIPRVRRGLGTAIVSTSEGLMTGAQARRKNLGGELLCYVW